MLTVPSLWLLFSDYNIYLSILTSRFIITSNKPRFLIFYSIHSAFRTSECTLFCVAACGIQDMGFFLFFFFKGYHASVLVSNAFVSWNLSFLVLLALFFSSVIRYVLFLSKCILWSLENLSVLNHRELNEASW